MATRTGAPPWDPRARPGSAGSHVATSATPTSTTGAATNATGSSALTEYSRCSSSRVRPTGAHHPQRHPHPHRGHPLAQHQPHHLGSRRAQRQAHPDLPGALVHQVGQHAVDAHRGQHQRQPRHQPQQQRVEALRARASARRSPPCSRHPSPAASSPPPGPLAARPPPAARCSPGGAHQQAVRQQAHDARRGTAAAPAPRAGRGWREAPSSRPSSRTSRTTPMISRGCGSAICGSWCPMEMRWPSGSSPGQYGAPPLVDDHHGRAPVPVRSSSSRPRTRPILSASK